MRTSTGRDNTSVRHVPGSPVVRLTTGVPEGTGSGSVKSTGNTGDTTVSTGGTVDTVSTFIVLLFFDFLRGRGGRRVGYSPPLDPVNFSARPLPVSDLF